jgi:PAS domain S-box-containing protein
LSLPHDAALRYIVAVTVQPNRDPAPSLSARPGRDEQQPFEGPWLELAMRAADMGAICWTLADDTLYMNERTAAIFGTKAGVFPCDKGERLFWFIHPEDFERARGTVLGAIAKGEPYQLEHRSIRPRDKALIWILTAGVPIRDERGKVVRVIGVLQDITARKAAESQREILVAELDHRIKNVLASVQSMASQSARRAPSLDAFLKNFQGRLKAMASAHTLLTATRWRGAAIQHIVAAELSSHSQGQTRWEGPEITLTPRATNALALALHELAANAVKFGALSTEHGHVDVSWRPRSEGGFVLQWVESGGPIVTQPTREGFGRTLLDRVSGRELSGEARLEFLATGVRATIVVGPDAVIAAPAKPERAVIPERTVAGASVGDVIQRRAAKVAGLNILIVEDSLLLSLELENRLTEAGAKIVGQAQDVPEALSMLNLPIDAAVLDANLNGQSVAPVAEALRRKGTPFIFATGYGDNLAAPQGFNAPFIRKPYDVTQVAAALAEVTGRA